MTPEEIDLYGNATATITRLREALAPFAKDLSRLRAETGLGDDAKVFSYGYTLCTLGDFRRAAEVLRDTDPQRDEAVTKSKEQP